MGSASIKIILAEWGNYPFRREKQVADQIIPCGSERILENMRRFDPGMPFELYVIVNQCRWLKRLSFGVLVRKFLFVKKLIFRSNEGLDFGAYNEGYHRLLEEKYYGDVLFMNSSVSGPSCDGWLTKYGRLFHAVPKIGLTGITLNSSAAYISNAAEYQFRPHVQSFFFYSNMQILKSVFGDELPGAKINDKKELIDKGEIETSQKLLRSGYGINCSVFPGFNYFLGTPWRIPRGDLRFQKGYERFINAI